MPTCKVKILAVWEEQGKHLVKAQFNRKPPPKGSFVDVRFGAKRSLMQNSFYFAYLTFLWDDCELKKEYLTVEELHETLKATFLSKRITNASGIELIKVGSTTKLDKIAFSEYLERIDKAVTTFHNLDTSSFWKEYAENYKL